jgi:D-alanyl-lipoteichoic acid acyltransferase DltB (MBOAT superfamily)
MVFNSCQFFVFMGFFYLLYIATNGRVRVQNALLLVASYVFYGSWDWRFLSLLFASTVLDYVCGMQIYRANGEKRRKAILGCAVFGNLFILGVFKYFNFFSANLHFLLSRFGLPGDPVLLKIILPLGISFYTFQTMSYSIDIYRGEMKPARNFLDFAVFVAFFPHLVAGPILRAKSMMPQIMNPRRLRFSRFYEGCHLMVWGYFLKVFVADNLALIVDPVFSASGSYNGVTVLLSLYSFAFQIFGDFAGYSCIAMGLGKWMGFDIPVNFNLPYFATNPQGFWKRWHMSLSTWFLDYLFMPLSFTWRGLGGPGVMLALMVTFTLCGFWHGASWTFVLWGAYHGSLLCGYRMLQPVLAEIGEPRNRILRNAWLITRMVFCFHLVCLGWLFFRAGSISQVKSMLGAVLFNFRVLPGIGIQHYFSSLVFYIAFLLAVQVLQYRKNDLEAVRKYPLPIRAAFYYTCLLFIMFFGVMKQNGFIYFQF